MRAIFTRLDNFVAMFVAMFAVAWSTVFMPLLGGPLHIYETQAIGAGWQSLRSGQAANLDEAFEVATNLPVEAVFPSAHAEQVPLELVAVEPEPDPLELLGGPDVDLPPPPVVRSARIAIPSAAVARVAPQAPQPIIEIQAAPAPACDIPAMMQGLCDPAQPDADALAAST